MSVLYVVIPIALLMSVGAVATFLWAVRRGQFDDLSTPSMRMLHDDDLLQQKPAETEQEAKTKD
jgi:cbb3-type cytochrome oxidase maturation protein